MSLPPGARREVPLAIFSQLFALAAERGPATVLDGVYAVGIGTIWLGRQWPPENSRYVRPSEGAVDVFLRSAFELLPEGQRLMLDTASGYGEAEQRLGAWLSAHPDLAARVVVATKFGETFDAATGVTTIDLSAAAAASQLAASQRALGGPIGLYYSHITSQVSADAAAEVFADAELRAVLRAAKDDGRVGLLGTSCSFPDVVRPASARLKHRPYRPLPFCDQNRVL